MTNLIETDRLILRSLELRDAPAISRLIGEWEVIKWLSKPPYPYARLDAEWFVGNDVSNGCYGIQIEGAFAGVVGLTDEFDLGYWLGQPFRGHGYMTEAALAVISEHFDMRDDRFTSGYFLANDASGNVLEKCGFRNTVIKAEFSVPRDGMVEVQRLELTQENWRAKHG